MWEYKNGNYTVRILDDGTKYRLSDDPMPEYPESIDVKVTNRCNGGCAFCHEKSTITGKHFDVNLALKLFKDLPRGIELAIGGGNPLEVSQDLRWLFRKTYNKAIFNLTVNAMHIDTIGDLWPNAIGISYRKDLHDKIKKFCDEERKETQKVIHLIAGVHSLDDLKRCLDDFKRVLVLGYKQVGRGATYYNNSVSLELDKWKANIGSYLYGKKNIIVFDNLSISQLDVKRFFTKERWNDIYMGDDGQFTMYLDLVEKKYAVSSRSEERYDIGDLSVKEMFQKVRSIN